MSMEGHITERLAEISALTQEILDNQNRLREMTEKVGPDILAAVIEAVNGKLGDR